MFKGRFERPRASLKKRFAKSRIASRKKADKAPGAKGQHVDDDSQEMNEATLADCCHDVHTDHVALPEVRTGEYDAEDDFAKTQDERSRKRKHRLSLEAVAIPEFHTGKVSAQETHEESEEHADDHDGTEKKHHLLGDMVHTLLSGTPENKS